MKRFNQQGSLHLGLLLGLVVIAAVAFAGYRVMSNRTTASTAEATASTLPAAIHTKADLTQTSKALDATDSQLDASLNDSSLDNDINSML